MDKPKRTTRGAPAARPSDALAVSAFRGMEGDLCDLMLMADIAAELVNLDLTALVERTDGKR